MGINILNEVLKNIVGKMRYREPSAAYLITSLTVPTPAHVYVDLHLSDWLVP